MPPSEHCAGALGRKSWLFCGSDRAGERAAVIYSLIGTAKLNAADPQAWLANMLARINDHPTRHELWSNLGDEVGGGVSSVMDEVTVGGIRHGGGYRRWAAAARRGSRE